ncbi:helix-turn-helix transcriptional regulator [Sphaerimonospora cavernae]|uniref:Helix-turn-helix transcriptional regulator n=1 Tax=Sphaerimonospora cavernae TaxID=1740611 RepID=A0ABV6U7A5_9ACTN
MVAELPLWAVRLRAERRNRLWSQKEMARRLVEAADEETRRGLPVRETIVRRIKAYEAGHNQPRDPYRLLYVRAFGVSEEDLFGEHVASSKGKETREGLPDESGALADERLNYAIKHPGSVDLVAVARIRERVHALGARYDNVSAASLLVDAGQHFGQVAFLRTQASSSLVQRELCTVEAEAATLMGQLVWDASQRRDHATTRAYLAQAVAAARQIHDLAAEGHALLRTSFVALYTEKDPQAALDLALQAAQRAGHSSLVLRGLGLLHAAEAYATLGRRQPDCEHALGEAETCFEQISTVDAAIDMFSPAQHGRLAGSCYLLLNDAKRAESILESTAQALHGRPKSKAIVLGNLALARVRQGKLDMAAASLNSAIDVVARTRGGGGFNIVFSVGRELRPWREAPVIRDVYDRLFALVAAA